MEAKPSLQTLPFELYLRIFQDVGPRDLLALEETCVMLRNATSNRVVWEEALKQTCIAHSYFEASYHLESMGDEEVKQAALGPHLWYKRLSRLARLGGTLEPRYRRTIPAPSAELDFTGAYLIPGGRYVLAATQRSISLLDLGSPDEGGSAVVRLDTAVMEPDRILERLFQPEISGARTLRFLVEANLKEEDGALYPRMQVYEAGPLPGSTTLRLHQDLRVDLPGAFNAKLRGQYVVFLLNSAVGVAAVWDFVNSSVSIANLGGSVVSGLRTYELTLQNGEFLLAARRDEVRGYRVPPFVPVNIGGDFSLAKHIEVHTGDLLQPSFFSHLKPEQIPSRAPGVEWTTIGTCSRDAQVTYIDSFRETRPYGAWGLSREEGHCEVTISRRRADYLCAPSRDRVATAPHTTFSYDASTGGPVSYATSTEWDPLPPIAAGPTRYDSAPLVTQSVLLRYPKLVYSKMREDSGGSVEWIAVAVTGLRVPDARYAPLDFSTSGSRIVGFVVDQDRQHETRNCITVLDY